MKYSVTHTTRYDYPGDVAIGYNIVHLQPGNWTGQTCEKFRLLVTPEPLSITQRTDYFGNQSAQFNVEQPHRRLTITAKCVVDVERPEPPEYSTTSPWETIVAALVETATQEELDAVQFACPSPGISAFSGLEEYARISFPAGRPILEASVDLTRRIFEEFKYDPNATSVTSEIREAFEKRSGVCQDFAHFQIGCLRSLGIPARYVSGYIRTIPPEGQEALVGADASHAWASVWCGRAIGWVDLDPTNNQIVSNDHITVAIGREYSDVCPVKGVIVGNAAQSLAVAVSVEPIGDK
ncbi:transglutaminase family protein [Mariniblastus fucicola]|uniref:Protein-glutamine gamma-glutamyltransferase n=1 Tax=Mariniblastus fucicola TaxID=980251 RepID=A0A5B9PH51_9BACT|nr:transglutaminase family protein [Mariniblastus fucicola]QEG24585.1 Protein-glutamine gamma-glutamyltransferase [Mariniblastus fucicola]